ncbi:MAG: pdeM [Sphingobacteriaceae bacterium]|jgi:DNA ligase-associated metallophosphoesterase|nr:pdeM [Sphingobacteriaceae bacterium]
MAQDLMLLPQKALYWKEEGALIVADVHMGKVGHFRKAGIGIPKLMEQEDLAALSDLITEYKPRQIIFLGDLFHSDMNNDWDWLVLWRDLFPKVEMVLVRGNHDILHDKYYYASGFTVVEQLELYPFLFSHEPLRNPADLYAISGHIHPGVKLQGKGRQTVTLPCFFFGEKQAILPAFGKFTGNVSLKYKASDKLFGVLKHKVVPL